ncbi:MAG TPA: PEP-CTERM sorting domain-containing protein [Rhizomicrobium sp.]|jgi:hypothetical protein|nr:PEP-CTERM sorting domain-containing protein [Rhizomicrobium sp.]
MEKLWAGALVMGFLSVGMNAASADMSTCDLATQSQNCGLDTSAAGTFAPSLAGSLYSPGQPPVTPGVMLLGTTTDPTGINGLLVGGTTYNVTFSTTTMSTFTQGSTLSDEARSALVAALNSLGVTELGNQTPSSGYAIDVDNTFAPFTPFDGPLCTRSCSNWQAGEISECSQLGNDANGYYCLAADFTPEAVPEPGTLGLFGVAMLALGGLGLRRNCGIMAQTPQENRPLIS